MFHGTPPAGDPASFDAHQAKEFLEPKGGPAMRAVKIVTLMIAIRLTFGAGASVHADGLQDILFSSCIATGNYQGLPTSESETCQCWADVISQHLTPSAANMLICGKSVPFEKESLSEDCDRYSRH